MKTTKAVTVSLDAATLRIIDKLSQDAERTRSGTVRWLVRQHTETITEKEQGDCVGQPSRPAQN